MRCLPRWLRTAVKLRLRSEARLAAAANQLARLLRGYLSGRVRHSASTMSGWRKARVSSSWCPSLAQPDRLRVRANVDRVARLLERSSLRRRIRVHDFPEAQLGRRYEARSGLFVSSRRSSGSIGSSRSLACRFRSDWWKKARPMKTQQQLGGGLPHGILCGAPGVAGLNSHSPWQSGQKNGTFTSRERTQATCASRSLRNLAG